MVEELKLAVDIRKEGKIPAVLYGPDIENIPVVMDEKEFKNAISTEHGENVLLKVKPGSKKTVSAMIKEIQVHPVTDKIIHVDLCQINLTEEIEVEVPVEFEGEPVGVKTEGGVLEHVLRNVRVKCLPTEIPDSFILDVSELNIGEGLKVLDMPAVKGIQILDDPEQLVANVVAPTELKIEEEAIEEAAAEPEVIGKKAAEEAVEEKPEKKEKPSAEETA
jgi:large subunit ribosomal protein L25